MVTDKGIYSMKIILIAGFDTEIFHCFFTIREKKCFSENFPSSVDMNIIFSY